MTTLLIRIEADDPSDLDFIRTRCHGAVEEIVEDVKAEGRFDGNVEVSWEFED